MRLNRRVTQNSYDWAMPNPRVLHLATSLGGGAGIAARRIVQAQVDYEMDSLLCAANQSGAVLASHESILPRLDFVKLKSKALTFFQAKALQNSNLLVTPFSLSAAKDWLEVIGSADVIHIHAFYNLVNFDSINQLSEIAPIVVTLHDQRLFTGGCHYSGDCEGYKLNCDKCPQIKTILNQIPKVQLQRSIRVINSLEKIKFISPSHWLAGLAENSMVLSGESITVINNPVPNIFKPDDSKKPTSAEALRIGFISENLENPYKGLPVLIDALDRLPSSFQAEIRFIGRGLTPQLKGNFRISKEHFSDSGEIANVIRSCDVIIVPSLQDNSPSVISESLMCGIPVIGSRVGGITEMISDFNLPSFGKGNSTELSQIIENFTLEQKANLQHDRIRKKFSPESSASKHLEVYKEILA